MTPSTSASSPRPGAGLPPAARSRVLRVGIAWAVAAATEVGAYAVLALAIRDGGGIAPVLAAAALSLVVTVLVSRAGYLAGVRLAGDLYTGLGGSLARAKLSWFTAKHRARVTEVSGRAIPALMGVPAHQLQTFVLSPLVPVLLVLAVAVVIGPVEALWLAGLLAVALTAQVLAQRALARADAARHRLESAGTQAAVELAEHRELLFATAGPERALARAELVWAEQERAQAKTNRAAAPATLVSALASALPLAGMLVFVSFTGGFSEPAAALALLVLTIRAGAPIDDLALAGVAVSEVRSQLAAYRVVAQAPALPLARTTAEPVGHDILIDGVNHAPALSGITERVPAGSRVLVAGPSGSGKSTLLGLLLRFDDPDAGRITLGGVALTDLSEADLIARVSAVAQDPVVFTGTLAENLRIGRPQASDAELTDAARLAQLDRVLARDPLGLHQQVGANGSGLSGGERQRVAIARAVLKRAPVLVLDEATSALDEDTERLVARALADTEATVIVVTHRDPGLWNPDRVITLGGEERA